MRMALHGLAVVALLAVFAACGAAQTTYAIDPARSTLEIDVYREGLLRAFGHDHLVTARDLSGAVQFDPNRVENSSVTLRVATKSLTVMDPGQSEKDRGQVQARMQGDGVLDVARYPEIIFQSNRLEKAERQGDGWRILLAGTLEIHGVRKPAAFPVVVRLLPDALSAQGEVFLLQTAFGITPVKVAGGTVKVKDRLRVRFVIHALGPSAP
jgi:polyisoprenoid-binding protein YceI